MFNVDCIASAKTYTRLTGKEPPDPSSTSSDEDDDSGDNDEEDSSDDDEEAGTKTNADPTRNDKGEDDAKKEVDPELTAEYLASLTVWKPDPLPDDHVSDAVFGKTSHCAHGNGRNVPTESPSIDNDDNDEEDDDTRCCDLCQFRIYRFSTQTNARQFQQGSEH